MFVGGPNSREDFHIEAGPEFFYQMKGDISVVVIEQGRPKIVSVPEGHMFLLPPLIPHSPQRPKDSFGLVVERERKAGELDCMRWYTSNDAQEVLFEKFFFCRNLGSDLVPIVQEFFASEEFQTRKPGQNVLEESQRPLHQDFETTMPASIPIRNFIEEHASALDAGETFDLFSTAEAQILICGASTQTTHSMNLQDDKDVFLYQFVGEASLRTSQSNEAMSLAQGSCSIVRRGEQFEVVRGPGSVGCIVRM
eukprot:c13849_g1_i1.p1 GENE.c13849_g1_i1~~c13849_g1_i1.p1  ORF type:complete len:252 (+),score=40.82 c13849_g1_i1:175-930(+)